MKKRVDGATTPATRTHKSKEHNPIRRQESSTPAAREKFAKALTKSAFGRYYWDERLEAELRHSVARPKKRRKK